VARYFDGSSNVRCAPGASATTGYGGFAVVLRVTASDSWLFDAVGLPNFSAYFYLDRLWVVNGFADRAGPTVGAAPGEGYVLLAAMKASGSQTPRMHKYSYETDTWTHENASSSMADWSVGNPVYIGRDASGSVRFTGDIAALGFFANKVLTDAQVEELPFSLTSWTSLGATSLWVLDQESTTQDVVDWTGGGGNQTALTGTAVSTESVPGLGYGHPVLVATHNGGGGGPATQDGTASLDGTGSLTPTATAERSGTATAAGTGSLAATAAAARDGSATAPGTGALTAASDVARSTTAALAGTAALAVTGEPVRVADAALAGAGSLAAAPAATRPGTALLAGTADLTLSATATRAAAGTVAGVGALTATATVVTPGGLTSSPTRPLVTVTRERVVTTVTRNRVTVTVSRDQPLTT